MVRYYGYYSNVSRGKRKESEEEGVPCILEADQSSKEYRKNWARLIQKIYEINPLTCPKCGGIMRIISFIEDREVIQAILKHLGLWRVKSRPTPKGGRRGDFRLMCCLGWSLSFWLRRCRALQSA